MEDTTPGELDDLLALEGGLTAWEIDFVDSVNKAVEAGNNLSPKQQAVIHKIWDRLCG